ncbi:hypothetical protein MMC07_001544 [Pseudocyphellaria aurata]|nr:hypothetical protein [Pseudocyphellaria aurata]
MASPVVRAIAMASGPWDDGIWPVALRGPWDEPNATIERFCARIALVSGYRTETARLPVGGFGRLWENGPGPDSYVLCQVHGKLRAMWRRLYPAAVL